MKNPIAPQSFLLRVVPALITWVFLSATVLYFWQIQIKNEKRHLSKTVSQHAKSIKNQIIARTEARVWELSRMSKRWQSASKWRWVMDVHVFMGHFKDCEAIEWMDPPLRGRWVVTSKGEKYRQSLESKLEEQRKMILNAEDPGKDITITPSSDLIGEERGFLIFTPNFEGARLNNLLIGAFSTKPFFESIISPPVLREFGISISESGREIYRNQGWIENTSTQTYLKAAQESKQQELISLYGNDWLVNVWPSPEEISESYTQLPKVTLVGGLSLAFLLSLVIYLGQMAHYRAKSTTAANLALQQSEQTLQRAKITLEARVSERTRELSQTNGRLAKELIVRERAELKLTQSNSELEQFAHVASHDLKEPLRMVTSYVQMIEQRYTSNFDERGKTYMRYVLEGAKRINVSIDALLAYSRAGNESDSQSLISTDKILRASLDNLQISIRESNAQITYDPMPPIWGEETQIIQLFQNLVANAMKFHGEAPPVVHIGAITNGDEVIFSVKDNGIGIESKHFDRIFIIFRRLHERNAYPGTGIGLAICKKIVERNKGKIWVQSEPGKGSTFFFSLRTTSQSQVFESEPQLAQSA
jgi:signal transduction histidine kinase